MAVRITGDFQFDSEAPPDQAKGRDYNAKKSTVNPSTPDEEKEGQSGKPFALRDLNLSIPRGSLVCVVGRVGTGKTTLLLAMINELRQVHGEVLFGGPVSYGELSFSDYGPLAHGTQCHSMPGSNQGPSVIISPFRNLKSLTSQELTM